MRRRTLSVVIISPITIALLLNSRIVQSLLVTDASPRHAIYLIHPWLLWTNVALDSMSSFSYALFFCGVWWLVRQLKEIPRLRGYRWVFTALKILILASGATQISHIITVWWPFYLLSTILKVVCAAASIPTAILFALQAGPIASSVRRFFDLLSAEQVHGEELRKSQDLLDRTGRIAGVGGWTLDLQTSEATWTTETYRIHGLPPGEPANLADAINLYTPESRPILREAVEKAITTGQFWDLELAVIQTDGTPLLVRSVGEVDSRDGKPVRLIGAVQDKTAQIAARRELRQANERVTLATDSGGIGIFDWDIATDLCTSDPWMHRHYDVDAPGKPMPAAFWLGRMHPEDRECVVEALQDAIADKKPYDTEFRVIWRDSSIHTLRATGKVIRDEAGVAIRIIGANWDVTESRQLTAELAEQHELLRITLESIGDGVITIGKDCNVAWLNPAAERMTGWSTAQGLGKPLNEVFRTLNADTRAATESPVSISLVEGNTVSSSKNTLLVSREGSEFGIENLAAPIRNGRGDLLGNVLVFRDVTEQRRLAAETEQIKNLQIELKTKDEFLSHVSHELRSPLTSIYSFSSIIADDLAGDTSEQQKEYLGIILKNVTQLQSMIEDLLTVTQSREGKLSIELQSVPTSEAVEDAVNTVLGSAIAKQIDLSAADSSHLPAACADPTRLRQILIILLDNAIKFTPSGGKVSVNVTDKDSAFLLFQVTDTGCGVPPDKRTRIFENLYQITGPDQPDTSQAGRTGLGLGLHIARSLVTRHGGYIWVTGEPGEGSTFNFILPVYSEATAAAGQALANDTPRRRKTDLPLEERPPLEVAA